MGIAKRIRRYENNAWRDYEIKITIKEKEFNIKVKARSESEAENKINELIESLKNGSK